MCHTILCDISLCDSLPCYTVISIRIFSNPKTQLFSVIKGAPFYRRNKNPLWKKEAVRKKKISLLEYKVSVFFLFLPMKTLPTYIGES